MFRRRHFFCILLLSGIFPLAAQTTADPGISVNVLSNRVALGEISQLIIKVLNGEAEMPQSIPAQGLEVVFSGSQSAIKIINGVSSAETTYFYRFRGDTPGTFTIPAFEIRLKGKTVMTQPIEITIFEQDQSAAAIDATKPFFGKLELTKTEFYVNEIVPFTLNVYVRGRNSISDVTGAKLENESFVFKGFRDVRTDGSDVGNVYYSSAVIPSTLFALKAGQHRLGPAQIGVRVLDASSGMGLSAFFQRNTPQDMVTNTVNVTVKPLPDSAPVSFTGGVGVFKMAGKASITTVSVGDPISMEFVVNGTGNLQTMGAPVFGIPQTGIWKSYAANKELSAEGESDGFSVGRVKFSQVIIPEAKTDTIPTFLLTYFDPSTAKYVTLRTDPIPITVTNDSTNEAPTAIQFPGANEISKTAPGAMRPNATFNDVMYIRTGTPRWVASAGSGKPGTAFYLVQALFSIAFCTVGSFGAMRWFRHLKARRLDRHASITFAQALKQLPGTGAPRREFFHAVSEALIQWSKEHPEPPEAILKVINHLSDRCATVLYSGMGETDTPVSGAEVAEFEGLLKKLPRR